MSHKKTKTVPNREKNHHESVDESQKNHGCLPSDVARKTTDCVWPLPTVLTPRNNSNNNSPSPILGLPIRRRP